MEHWKSSVLPPRRHETLFGDRLLECFSERPGSIYQLWQRWVQSTPDHPAIKYEQCVLTYAQADARIAKLAAGLKTHGLARGDRVALFMDNHVEYILCLLALQRLAVIAVPIGIREQLAGVAYILDQCEARGIIFDAPLQDKVPDSVNAPALQLCISHGHCASCLDLTSLEDSGAQLQPTEPASCHEQDTAIILYTSGTTGQPKGAMLTHVNIAHSVRHLEIALKLSSQDKVALTLPLSHVSGLITVLLTTFSIGATCIIAPPFKADDFLAFMEKEAITYTLLVPAMYSLCLLSPQLEQRDLSHWRIGMYGGAPMAASTIEKLAHVLPNLGLINAYGATETTAPTSISPVPSDIAHANSIGAALPCAHVRIMDEHGAEVPRGVDGELWIGGPMTIPGYWNNPEATKASFTAGFWRSGDIGHVNADGHLYLVDRMKDMLSRGGYKIYSQEVENRLMAYPGVLEAAIVGKPCPVLGERVHAFIYAPDALTDTESLRRHCAETLTDYKVPESITLSPHALPRNANGKILKQALREALQS